MAITWVREQGKNRADADDDGGRRYTRVWLVKTDSLAHGPLEIARLPEIPRMGSPYVTTSEADLGARVRAIRPERDDADPYRWFVTVEYDTKHNKDGDKNQPGDDSNKPTNRASVIKWGTAKTQELITKGFRVQDDGSEDDEGPLLNSAGDPYADPPQRDRTFITLTITRNQSTFDPTDILAYVDSVNADSFFGVIAGKWKCEGIEASEKTEDDQVFWEVTYQFLLHPKGWLFEILDAGTRGLIDNPAYVPGGGEPVKIRVALTDEATKTPNSTAVPLDGAGSPLDSDTAMDDYVYRSYRVYDTIAFSGLNLP